MRLLVGSLVFMLGACAPPEGGRVLVVGLDGASMDLVRPMMDEGRLPNLARLAHEGVSGRLRSERPLLSPRVWTSIATGKTPSNHGVGGWVWRDPNGQIHLFEGLHRRGPALWNIASDAGLKVVTVNWLMTYPPEVINGVMVTDHALPKESDTRRRFGNRFANKVFKRGLDDEGTTSAPFILPTSWAKRLWPILFSIEPLTHPNPFDTSEELKGVALRFELSHFYWNDQRATRAALKLEEELRPDVLLVLLQGIDRVSHSLWGTLHPETAPGLTEPQRLAGAKSLRHYYEISDALVGRLAERFGSRNLVMVVSDHGFEYIPGKGTHPWGGSHESEKALHGILFARGQGLPKGHTVEGVSVNDVTPTILAWLGLPVARDMDGQPAAFLEREVQYTDSYDGLRIERVGGGRSDVEAEILRQLEGLGYIDEN